MSIDLPAEYELFSKHPDRALQAFGKVQNLEDEEEVSFDPRKLTFRLQQTVLGYIANPPMDAAGFQRWLVILKSRQSGISTTVASGYYVKAQYTPGWNHVTTADKKERADMLFERVQYLHARWPEQLKVPQISANQIRSYQWTHNGKMSVMSGAGKGMAIGASPSSWHWSEVPLWPDAAKQWSYAAPALMNRRSGQMIWESTPFPLSEPSSEFFKDLCLRAAAGDGRFLFAFEPFWDGVHNRRPWRKDWVLTHDEIRMLEQYGPLGLKKDNLAFRRHIMDVDHQISKNPELFRVFYPFDDLTCWMSPGSGVIKSRHLERHLRHLQDFDSGQGWSEFQEPRSDATYVIGVDPSGYGARDHCAFQVLEVWAGSWRQVYVYASEADPPEFTRHLAKVGRRFNNAQILIERNGVGVATLALLEEMRYPNLYWESPDKPGLHKSSGMESQLVSLLVDALNETLVLRDRETVAQLMSYRSDRAVQRSLESEVLAGDRPDKRRGRHHWDKVSALMYAVMAARAAPQNLSPHEMYTQVRDTSVMSANDLLSYERSIKRIKPSSQRRSFSRKRSTRWRGHAR